MQKTKKYIFIIASLLLFLSLVLRVSFNSNNNISTKSMIAVTIDGNTSNEFPDYNSGKYTVNVDCQNATGIWKPIIDRKTNTYEWKFIVDNIIGDARCTIDFKTKTNTDILQEIVLKTKEKTDINNGICSNEKYTTESDCKAAKEEWWGVFEQLGYRYQGANPDNFVLFNDEIWRIIGLVEGNDENNEEFSGVEIIRYEAIRANMRAINEAYFNNIDGRNADYCGETDWCNFKDSGMSNYAKQMIKKITLPEELYKGYTITTITITDFILASIGVDPNNNDFYDGTNSNFSHLDNWLVLNALESDVGIENGLGTNETINSVIRPVVYLKEEVYVVDGTGTITDPYILDM